MARTVSTSVASGDTSKQSPTGEIEHAHVPGVGDRAGVIPARREQDRSTDHDQRDDAIDRPIATGIRGLRSPAERPGRPRPPRPWRRLRGSAPRSRPQFEHAVAEPSFEAKQRRQTHRSLVDGRGRGHRCRWRSRLGLVSTGGCCWRVGGRGVAAGVGGAAAAARASRRRGSRWRIRGVERLRQPPGRPTVWAAFQRVIRRGVAPCADPAIAHESSRCAA